MIYTSGSTGNPKGAMNTHSGLLNRLLWMQEAYGLNPDDRVMQKTPFSFDVSVWEFFWPLMRGAGLVVAQPGGHRDTGYLAQLIQEENISTMHFVPSMLSAFVDDEASWSCSSLKRVICSGEALSYDLQKRFLDAMGAELHNLYGPTEAAIDVTYWQCSSGDDRGIVFIGRPIANTEIKILDTEFQAVPIGVPGQLMISGEGLARGYFNNPELTAAKFMPDAMSERPGNRMYCTGDVARHQAAGEIEFLGRIDHQVKIRGFRIELGEIEAALAQHSSIAETVVVAAAAATGDKQLVAYYVATDGGEVDLSSVRQHLRKKLPEYMCPAIFIRLDQMPLSPNGKLDRKALPRPEAGAESESEYAAPRTPTEALIAGIWADLLHVERVGIHDNFFAMGGHSLLATQLMSRINSAFHLSLAVRVLFDSPTVGEMTGAILTALATGGGLEIPPVRNVSRSEPLPLSYAQENLWLFEQLSPGTAAYNTARSGRVFGRLNPIAVEETFNQLLARHESLRTSFIKIEGEPFQVINSHVPYSMPVVDLSGLSAEDRDTQALRISNEEAARPLDLGTAPVARAELLRLDAEDHVFVLTIHHIAYDLWSGGIILEEIESLYASSSRGEPTSLPDLPVQYADFAVWQREWLQGEVLDRQLSYWMQRLEGLSSMPMEIPTDKPRPAIESMRGSFEDTRISTDISDAVKSLARQEGVTEFIALLAVFQAMLHRYTGQDDLVAGSVIANRNRVELEGVVGFFDNTIVLRVDASGDPSFRGFLRRVRDVALGAYANQYLPFELLVKELQPERTTNRTPLIQALFVFLLNYPAMEREVAGLKVVPYRLQGGEAMFDLLLGIRESEKGLEGELHYNCDLFDAASIVRMCGHFSLLLESVVRNPDLRLSELPLLTGREQQQVLLEWNETRRPYGSRECMHYMFEDQAARTPDHVALVFENAQVSFAELNRLANQIGHFLRRRGVGSESRVGILAERSVEMVAGILGILKAGCAYVPLDPDYPPDRLAHMLEDGEAAVLLTAGAVQASASSQFTDTVSLNEQWISINRESGENLSAAVSAENLAYVIYTSGSTGKPKGVAITHRSAVYFLNWAREVFDPGILNSMMASTSICFDLSIFELFLPLCFGGRVRLVKNALSAMNPELRGEIALINTVPSAIREILNSGSLDPAVSIVNLAGESLSSELAERLYENSAIQDLYNLYGPSETTTYSTFTRIARRGTGAAPIGKPIANTQTYVLDSSLNPLPPGLPGELYIGGEGLARGYLSRPEQTADRFVPDHFGLVNGGRMYRTGDRVRWSSTGDLEFFGRIDHQVKIRGYRIELGEIESVLSRHADVREAAVLAREAGDGDKRLVAYLTLKNGNTPGASELRAHVREKLPEYMVPAAFVIVDQFPRTPSGKLNRRALPAPEDGGLQESESYVPPRDEFELQLCRIWERLLGIQRVGIRDSFFDLGGHSLLGLQLMARVHKQFGRELPLAALLQSPTVETLAALLRSGEGTIARSALVTLNSEGSRPPLFCVHPVGGSVLCYRELAQQLGPRQPFYAFQVPESTSEEKLDSIEAMASYYLNLLKGVQPHGPYSLGGWSMGGVVAFEMAQQLGYAGEEVRLLALIDSYAPSNDGAIAEVDPRSIVETFVEDLEGLWGADFGVAKSDLERGLDPDELLKLVLARLQSLETGPPGFGPAKLESLYETYRNNLTAMLRYRPRGGYGEGITLFRSAGVEANEVDRTLGWSRLSNSGVEVIEVEGDHYSLLSGPALIRISSVLSERLGETDSTSRRDV